MKANVCLIALLLVALLVTSCDHQKPTGTTGVVPSGGSSGVVIKEDTIVLNASNISASDADRINSILKHYDKRLFKWEKYQDGQLKTAKGEMSEAELSKVFKAAKVKRQVNEGFSHYAAAMMCCGGGSTHHPPPTPTPEPTATPTPPSGQVENDPKFTDLKSILEKYR